MVLTFLLYSSQHFYFVLTDFENIEVMELIDSRHRSEENCYASFAIRFSSVYSIYLVSDIYTICSYLNRSAEILVFLPAATKLGQDNIFTGVCLSTGRRGVCLSACWDIPLPPEQTPPSGSRHPPRSRPPLGADTPPPWEQTPSLEQTPPPREADFSIRSTSGRYASYWNAFLLQSNLIIQ